MIPSIFAAAMALLGPAVLVRRFQMLQQNSYFAARYMKWLKGSFKGSRVVGIVVSAVGAAFILVSGRLGNAATVAGLAVLFIYLVAMAVKSVSANRKSIKKLAVTARVKRMFAAAFVLFALLAALSCLGGWVGRIITAALFLMVSLPSAGTLAALVVMKPVEKTISRYYVNDAKKILRTAGNLRVIGVTGSYGKTSTKYILGRMLSEKYNTLITPENYNTPMGIVITVRRDLRPQTEIFVAEMGAKRRGDIREICEIADPCMGVITSVGPQHLDTFGSIETVVSTKFELAEHVRKNGGKMFLNTDNAYIREKAKDYNAVTYGTSDCDVKASDISYSPEGLTMTLSRGEMSFRVTSKLLGNHNALNIAAAAAVALELTVSPEQIAFAVSKLKPVEHRLQLKPYIGGSVLIDDAYNSNPEGCLEAVRVLGSFAGMKKVIVTPGLVELGDKEEECNRRLGEEAAKYCDVIILVGKKRSVPLAEGAGNFPRENLHVVSSFAEAVGILNTLCDQNTAVLIENDLPDNYLE